MRPTRAADVATDRDAETTRAARTAGALAAVGPDWALPWWLERQRRATHAAFVPTGDTGLVENLTGRSWTVLATTSSGPLALVDPAGSVQPVGANWSLDWVIGAEDRWYRPAVEPTVRQRLVAHAPVVETACKVPSGDAVARAYAIAGGAEGDAVVLEIENESPVPFVALVSVRPAHVLGMGGVSSIRLDRPYVFVDERPVLLLDPRTARWSFADAPVDAIADALAGGAGADEPASVRSAAGLATAAFLVPVPHRTSVRMLVFPHATRRTRPARTSPVPAAGPVARGWEAHTAVAARLELPDRRVADAYVAALRGVVGAASGALPVPVGRERTWGVAEESAIVATLASIGLVDLAAGVLRHRCDEQGLDSWFRREPSSITRNVALFEALGAHWWASQDRSVIDDVLGGVVKAAHWTERARSRAPRAVAPALARRAAAALRDLAAALRGAEQPDAAADLDAFAARFVLDLDDVGPPAAEARSVPAAGEPGEPGEPGAIGELGAIGAIDAIHAIDEIGDASAGAPEDRVPSVDGPGGADPAATARRARAELVARDPFAFERLAWLVQVGGPTTRWPTMVHPRLAMGCGGAGDDPAAAAAFLALVRALVVDDESVPDTLALLPVVPPSWYGQSVDVHDLPTRVGRLSFALRWHATRPALLWELAPHDPDARITLTVPGLDPTWSSTAAQGETLLAMPPLAGHVPVAEHPDTDHVPMTTLEPRLRRDPSGAPAASPAPPVPPGAIDEPGDSFA